MVRYFGWICEAILLATGKTETQLSTSLTIGKSTNEVFLSRTFVEAIFEELNMERLLNQINDPQFYGVDEIFFHTLVINSWMRLPGQIQNPCGLRIRNLARWTHWDYGKDSIHCHSKALRHNICILGVEYLPIVRDRPEILANKVNQEFDFGTILCMRKSMNRIESGSMIEGHLEMKHYERLPQVGLKKC
ncbi:hypothetical protein WR25_18148 isoform F [Diploscapter pachys]|uniref:Uncharacterized protein n=1 Tax=Diploscapter pachys TaxID=2018661 RepID=A0A2A2LZ67_9BILA|nr:hypothetical protein WR25_18148 isoform B [Diploscapter pachys]PAV91480.1 hypothetical protein WR25_18148 isoform D [Diploscapter pachys]PAV91482.1 hypothetical protein WR25_18148 isoform F [Diploscapter pachys]